MDWGWLTNLLWIAPALWLLFGLPWQEGRRKAKSERERKRRDLEWELAFLYAERGREGLEAKLIADMRTMLVTSILHAPEGITGDELKDVFYGKIPEGMEDFPIQTKDEWVLYFWPRMPRGRRKK